MQMYIEDEWSNNSNNYVIEHRFELVLNKGTTVSLLLCYTSPYQITHQCIK